MPKVPTNESQVRINLPGIGPLMSYDDPIGQAISRTGRAITQAGLQTAEYLSKRRERIKEEQDQARLLDAQTRFEEEERQFHEKAGTMVGRDASGAANQGVKFYRDNYAKYSEEFRDRPDLQRHLDVYFSGRMLKGLDYLSRISARGHWEDRKALLNLALEGKKKDAVTWASDPKRVNAAMDEYAGLIRQENLNRDVEPMVEAARATILTLTTDALLAQGNVAGAELLLAQHERGVPEKTGSAIRQSIKSASQNNAINNAARALHGADEATVDKALNETTSPLDADSKTMVKEMVATDQAVEKRRQADAEAADLEEKYRQYLKLYKDGKLDAPSIMSLGFDEREQRRLLVNHQQANALAICEAQGSFTAQDRSEADAAVAGLIEKEWKFGLKYRDLVDALPYLNRAEVKLRFDEMVKGNGASVSGLTRLTNGLDLLLEKAKDIYRKNPEEYHQYVIELEQVLKETKTPFTSRNAVKLGQNLLIENTPGFRRLFVQAALDRTNMIKPGNSAELSKWDVKELVAIPNKDYFVIRDYLKTMGKPTTGPNILHVYRRMKSLNDGKNAIDAGTLDPVDLSELPDQCKEPVNHQRENSLALGNPSVGLSRVIERASAFYWNDMKGFHRYLKDLNRKLTEADIQRDGPKAITVAQELLIKRTPGASQVVFRRPLTGDSYVESNPPFLFLEGDMRQLLSIPQEDFRGLLKFLESKNKPGSAANILHIVYERNKAAGEGSTQDPGFLEKLDLSKLPDQDVVNYDELLRQSENQITFGKQIGPSAKLGGAKLVRAVGLFLYAKSLEKRVDLTLQKLAEKERERGLEALLEGRIEDYKISQQKIKMIEQPTIIETLIRDAYKYWGTILTDTGDKLIADHPEWRRPDDLKGEFFENMADSELRPAYLARLIGENGPELLLGLGVMAAVGFATKNPFAATAAGAAVTYAMEMGYTFDELKDKVGEEEAARIAGNVAILVAAIDLLPLGELINTRIARRIMESKVAAIFIKNPKLSKTFAEGVLQVGTEYSVDLLRSSIGEVSSLIYKQNIEHLHGVSEADFTNFLVKAVVAAGVGEFNRKRSAKGTSAR